MEEGELDPEPLGKVVTQMKVIPGDSRQVSIKGLPLQQVAFPTAALLASPSTASAGPEVLWAGGSLLAFQPWLNRHMGIVNKMGKGTITAEGG